jgi:hypothetical protein
MKQAGVCVRVHWGSVLTFPAALAQRWMPGLFPEKIG